MDAEFCTAPPVNRIYHATPLHYLPEIVSSGELRSLRLVGFGRGRPTARSRDRSLAVDDYVHFSLVPETPLLAHKRRLGYPHAVLELDIRHCPDLRFAVLSCSTKAWRSKWQCQPITERHDVERLIRLSTEGNRLRNLEFLIKHRVPLRFLRRIYVATPAERDLVLELLHEVAPNLCEGLSVVGGTPNPQYTPKNLDLIADYFRQFVAVGISPEMPQLPFD
jgi:hypothetical protein